MEKRMESIRVARMAQPSNPLTLRIVKQGYRRSPRIVLVGTTETARVTWLSKTTKTTTMATMMTTTSYLSASQRRVHRSRHSNQQYPQDLLWLQRLWRRLCITWNCVRAALTALRHRTSTCVIATLRSFCPTCS